MTIDQVLLSNTFNEFRVAFNNSANAINSIQDGTGNANVVLLTSTTGSIATLSSNVLSANSLLIANNLTVNGDLTVNGTQTILNTNILSVEDINIEIARNATTSAQADGAGITINGAGAQLIYKDEGDKFTVNKTLDAGNNVITVNNAPTQANQVSNKQYTDGRAILYAVVLG